MIECKSEISKFATKSVPEIKSNLDLKPFSFEPNQKLFMFTKSAKLGIIRLGNGTTEMPIDQSENQSDLTCIDEANSFSSSSLPEHEAKVLKAGDMCNFKSSEDHVWVELEEELKLLRQTTSVEKKEKEILQHSYDTLKTKYEDHVSSLSREREDRAKYVLEIKELEQRNVLLKQEVSSLNDLNTSLKSQLGSRKKEFDLLESTYNARQEQDHKKIKSLQSELRKISENHEKECKRRSSQIQDLQIKSAKKTYGLPDPRAAGFDVGKRVKDMLRGSIGTVTVVDPSGYVDVRCDHGRSRRYTAGAGGEYEVKLL